MRNRENEVILGDSLDVMRDLPSESIDMILTDPPYGVSFQSNMPVEGFEKEPIQNDGFEEYLKMLPKMFARFKDLLRPNGCLAMFCSGGGRRAGLAHAWLKCEEYLEVENVLVWDRLDIGLGWTYRPQWEAIILAFKDGRAPGGFYGPQNRSNVLRYPRIIPKAGDHPTPKPVPLAGTLLEDNTKEGELVLDPFCGSGRILEAAHILKRRWLGVELDKKHHAAASRRMEALLAQGDLF
jgi:site-specific DNA-methyltransferase (adenine-specific)